MGVLRSRKDEVHMKHVLLGVLLGVACASWGQTLPAESGMRTIFNGKDLTGWDGDPRFWSVTNGIIRGETTPANPCKGNTFLVWTAGRTTDFELRLSFRCTAANNSGVQYRSTPFGAEAPAKWRVKGYQHELRNENKLPNVSGFIYDEGGKRGRICLAGEKAVWNTKKNVMGSLIDAEGYKKLMKLNDWNEIAILARGNHIQHYLNGQLVLDFTDEAEVKLLEGVLALQLHAGKPMWAEFKNIRIKDLK